MYSETIEVGQIRSFSRDKFLEKKKVVNLAFLDLEKVCYRVEREARDMNWRVME